MRILVLGGTRFVGRAFVEAALARHHEVTLFHRGKTNESLFPTVETILGDRETDLDRLKGRKWDVVVDTCGYVPRVVGLSVDTLREAVGRYLFVSTISVYADPRPGADESAPLATLGDPTVEEITGETYGGLKVLCEARVKEAFGERATLVRPGLIVGPHDPTDRFTYWPMQFLHGGDVLAPKAPNTAVQAIDSRDLGSFMLRLAENDVSGTYNATGPTETLLFPEFLEETKVAIGSTARIVPVDPAFLAEHEVAPWTGLPFWVGDDDGIARIAIDRARAAGLELRPLRETIRDTAVWRQTREEPLKAGISSEKAQAVLDAWAARISG
ncbi:MAG TPA: hypothetical protein PLH94_04955 [Fimbriimonadaceae bacterium]|nr:hypothetical protein [Fimbriimonadaceae bacterium]